MINRQIAMQKKPPPRAQRYIPVEARYAPGQQAALMQQPSTLGAMLGQVRAGEVCGYIQAGTGRAVSLRVKGR